MLSLVASVVKGKLLQACDVQEVRSYWYDNVNLFLGGLWYVKWGMVSVVGSGSGSDTDRGEVLTGGVLRGVQVSGPVEEVSQ